MKHARALLARTLCLCVCLALIASLAPLGAMARARRVVRVGFFAFEGYHDQSASGARSGYGYEFLQHMAGYTNWRYEYVGYEKSWSEMQDMLARGEIDLLTSAQKTPERMERFDFSRQSIGTSAAILTVRAGEARYVQAEYPLWSGMRVGMIEGSTRNDSFAAFAAQHGFSYVPVYFSDTAAMVAALRAGDGIDAVLTSNLRRIEDEWILAQFDPAPFYIMTRKGDAALMDEINRALDQLFNAEPELRAQLMNQYYAPSSGEGIAFTAQERAFIAAMRDTAFTAAICPDRPPYAYIEDGRPAGMLYDVAQEIIGRCGLNIRFADVKTRAEYDRLVESGQIDIRFDAGYNFARAEALDGRLTVPYLEVPIARLYLRGQRAFSSAALLRNSDMTDIYQDELQARGMKVSFCDTLDELVNALVSGNANAAYLGGDTASLLARNDVTNCLVSEELHGYAIHYALCVDANADPLLYSILNKTVASLQTAHVDALSQRYAAYGETPFSLIGFIYDRPLAFAGYIAIFFLVAGLIVILAHTAREKKAEFAMRVEQQRRNELLAGALESAEKADNAKSQFLSRVSHEMRTPLNAILGFLELAKDADDEQSASYLANADVAARQLLNVINDVLDMSSIESGKLAIAHATFDFKQMIHAITGIYLPLCRQKGLAYETMILTPVDEWLVGDQLRVNQILINLLGNAVKFTQTGHVFLKISQHDRQGENVFIRIEVEDTGCGMNEETQSRLFKPFEQADASTAMKYGGNGLGLSIVKSLVGMMDGAICVQSELGVGSTFTVDLPFAKSARGRDIQVPGDAKSLRVLVVDDEQSERKYLAIVLGRMDVRHTCVAKGEEALAELARARGAGDPYGVCLIDWRMPVMSGIEITRRIREEYGDDPVVIVVSAYEHNQASQSAKAAGASLFLAKPLFQSTLLDLFMTLSGGQIARRKSEPARRDFTGRRVLLAEDNVMNRLVAQQLIKRHGIEYECAEDGKIALEKFLASPPGYYDAILMDIQMPNMNGLDATRAIRASAHVDARIIPIIALTANAFTEDIVRTLSSGMNAHVAKPIEPALLIAALEKAFASRDR